MVRCLSLLFLFVLQVSAIGVILLCGLYISSMSSSLGSLYATPRILQRMAIDGVLPGSHYLAEGVSLYPLFIQPGTWHSFMLAYFNSVNSVENKGHLQYLTNCQQHVYNVRGPAEKSVCALVNKHFYFVVSLGFHVSSLDYAYILS